jgi:hypothetical protein
VSGTLALDAAGTLRFTLDETAAGASLGRLEKQLAADGLADRIKEGERPQAFAIPWPTPRSVGPRRWAARR